MRAVFDHSWRLLNEREREVFKALSIFRGGFTPQAAQRVTGATLREFRALMDKSLLERDSHPDGHYGIHELLRQYAAQKLGTVPAEEEAARDRHCAYYAGFLQQREADLIGWNQKKALAEIEAEIENVRASWNWAVGQGRIEDIDRSLESLAEFYRIRAWFQEGEQTFVTAAQRLAREKSDIASGPEVGRDSRIVLGKVLMQQGLFCDPLGLAEQGIELLQKSLAILRDLGARREMAYALCYLREKPSCQEALAIFEEIGDRRGLALSLEGLACIAYTHGEYRAARQLFQESLAISREIGNQERIARYLHALGYMAWMLGEYGMAKELHQESLVLCREIGDQNGVADALGYLGLDVLYGFKEYGEAEQLFHESLAVYEEIGNLYGIGVALSFLGELADVQGEYAEAIQLAQRSLALAKKCRDVTQIPVCLRILGRAACGLGDLQAAKRYFHEALETAMTERAIPWVLSIFDGIPMLLAREGERERALELLTWVVHNQASAQISRDTAAPLVAELEAELPPDVVAAAQARGRARDLEATVAELLVELSG
jgi:tetratricopeptide (TPR) repeat protein